MSSKAELIFLSDCTKRDFGILKKWTNSKMMTNDESYENLENLISYHISKMIDNDYGKLMDLLYKTDIDEKKVKSCFDAEKTSSEIARDIAKLYLLRIAKKHETRQQFSNPDIVGDWD